MNTKLRKAGSFIKKHATNGFQSSCAITHLTLRYSIDLVEHIEGVVVNKLYPEQDKTDIIDDRRKSSNRTRLEHQRAVNTVRRDYREFVATKFGGADEAITNTIIHETS